MKQFSILITIFLLVAAIFGLGPIGAYQILRWTVMLGAIIWAMNFYDKNQGFFITFCIIAILFNPIIPIYLGRELWQIVDFIAGAIFVLPVLKND